jgi:hypothetical protein
MKTEIAQAHADRRKKIQGRIDQLQARIDSEQKKFEKRREAVRTRQNAKREVLKKNAATAGRALKELGNTRL